MLGGLVEDVALDTLKGYFEDEKLRRSIFSPTSSSNAPVNYFDAPATFPDQPGVRYWDGATMSVCRRQLRAIPRLSEKTMTPERF